MLPSRIAVVGGGRWARVLVETLCNLVPASVAISAHSRGHADAMAAWAAKRDLEGRIEVSHDMPRSLDPTSSAIVVANAAANHPAAVEFALAAGIPVLVEKPIAPSATSAHRLAEFARVHGTRFAAANIFLFARYLDNFATAVANAGAVESLRLEWADPKDEAGYGERKRYDPSLPIYADLLPHVVSIFGAVARRLPDGCRMLRAERGGALVELEILLDGIACGVRLERESTARQRLLRVIAGSVQHELDFSTEPGVFRCGGTTAVGDLLWDDPGSQRPVGSMLSAFLTWAAGGTYDYRLALEPGLRACEFSDLLGQMYRRG